MDQARTQSHLAHHFPIILDIIDAGLAGDPGRVRAYTQLLLERIESDMELCEEERSRLVGQLYQALAKVAQSAIPIDSEPRVVIATTQGLGGHGYLVYVMPVERLKDKVGPLCYGPFATDFDGVQQIVQAGFPNATIQWQKSYSFWSYLHNMGITRMPWGELAK
jgi:hypothetical protein